MLVDSIALIILIGAAIPIFLIVQKKLRLLASIDVDSLPAERDAAVKNRIIEDRISRQIQRIGDLSKLILEPLMRVGAGLIRPAHSLYAWISDIRIQHQRNNIVGGSVVSFDLLSTEEKIDRLHEEAEMFLSSDRASEAEERYIDILALDKKSVDAYRGLACVYRDQKEWAQEKEVLLCASKLMHEQEKHGEGNQQWALRYAEILNDLADVYKHLDDPQKAWKCIKDAVELQRNNPKYLDALINIHVVLGQRLKAEQALDMLRRVNPENEKIDEMDEQIKSMAY